MRHRVPPQRLDALLAHPARRDVDDPLERHDVGVRPEHPQVGQGVLDLAPLVEPRAADELVADPVAEERLLDRAGLGVHPIHHGHVLGPEAGRLVVVRAPGEQRAAPGAPDQPLDLAGDPLGLLVLVVGLEALDRHAALVVRPEPLVRAPLVARDHGVRRVQDQLRGAVVLLQLDDRHVGVVALEVEDVLDVRAAPAVDRLVVVPHHAQVPVGRGQRPDPQVLRPVRVLVLVHVEVAPAGLVSLQHLGRVLEQLHGTQQQVVEVERVRRAEALPVAGRQLRDDPFLVVDGVLGEEHLVQHLVLRPADGAQDRGGAVLARGRQVLLGQDPLHQLLLVVRVVDDEAPVEPDRIAVAAQDAGAQGVEGAGLHLLALLPDQGDDPLPQLAGRAVGERHGQDPARLDRLDADQVRDAVGDDPGLAGAGSGEDQERAVRGGDGPGLLGVEVRDDLVGPRGAAGLERGGHGLRVEGWSRDQVGLRGRVTEPVRFLGDGGFAGGPRGRRIRRIAPGRPEVEPGALDVGLRGARAAPPDGLAGGGGTHRPILGWVAHPGINHRRRPEARLSGPARPSPRSRA